ncbi:DUF6916 family protein [Sphingomonas hengshuiensis]|uniref:DUF6916 domain-containing protein n=1 Tax=Sphingomonas hengshuiensis TaxID=1609977 RepID=A0A7U4J9A9_9SPHN|nr:hypothetical protein [Sphingomonas hengshuiensis]AJP72626.1 hypothetical protein TS85_13860 [Sphingomonas hengshuiensis]
MEIRTIHSFASAANQEFEIDMGASAVTATLIEVKPLQSYKFIGQRRDPFSLLFRSRSPVILPQKTYRVKNPTLGELDMFLVPVAREGADIVYQAVFN